MVNTLTLFLAQAQPPKMPPIQWPINPLVFVLPSLGLLGLCVVLLLVAWRFKWRWLLNVVEILLPDDEDDRPRRRRRYCY